jgi:hypothetical protein
LINGLLSTQEVERRVRIDPSRWLVGAGLAGIVAGRFFARPLARAGRRHVVSAVRARAGTALAAGILAFLGHRARRSHGDGTDGASSASGADSAPPGASIWDAVREQDPVLPGAGTTS